MPVIEDRCVFSTGSRCYCLMFCSGRGLCDRSLMNLQRLRCDQKTQSAKGCEGLCLVFKHLCFYQSTLKRHIYNKTGQEAFPKCIHSRVDAFSKNSIIDVALATALEERYQNLWLYCDKCFFFLIQKDKTLF